MRGCGCALVCAFVWVCACACSCVCLWMEEGNFNLTRTFTRWCNIVVTREWDDQHAPRQPPVPASRLTSAPVPCAAHTTCSMAVRQHGCTDAHSSLPPGNRPVASRSQPVQVQGFGPCTPSTPVYARLPGAPAWPPRARRYKEQCSGADRAGCCPTAPCDPCGRATGSHAVVQTSPDAALAGATKCFDSGNTHRKVLPSRPPTHLASWRSTRACRPCAGCRAGPAHRMPPSRPPPAAWTAAREKGWSFRTRCSKEGPLSAP